MTLKRTCVCGAISREIDLFDATMDGFYMTCSDACRSILATRESWSRKYGYDYLRGVAA